MSAPEPPVPVLPPPAPLPGERLLPVLSPAALVPPTPYRSPTERRLGPLGLLFRVGFTGSAFRFRSFARRELLRTEIRLETLLDLEASALEPLGSRSYILRREFLELSGEDDVGLELRPLELGLLTL